MLAREEPRARAGAAPRWASWSESARATVGALVGAAPDAVRAKLPEGSVEELENLQKEGGSKKCAVM